jgi:HlyD family secretion protein
LGGGDSDEMVLTDFVTRGAIVSQVTGEGVTLPKDSASISLTMGGMVQEVFVSEGDTVTEGQPLYRIDSTEAEKKVNDAQKNVSNLQKELNTLYEAAGDLNIRAEYQGKLMKVAELEPGDELTKGQVVATLVDDSVMQLRQYYSYAYESNIFEGQNASVSIPSAMAQVTGRVAQIHKVQRISSQGSMLFEVVIQLDNPGTLTEGMEAVATLSTASGEEIYPYEAASLSYLRSTEVKAQVAGTVESLNLHEYALVSAGTSLVSLTADSNDTEIAYLENDLQTAQKTLEEAEETLATLQAVAPIDGVVQSIGIAEGEEAKAGTVAISIANTTSMTIDASIDARNISYVSVGMPVEIDQWGTICYGTIQSVSLNGTYENGMSTFPAVIAVDNSEGLLMSGNYVQYSFTASQNDDCLLVPAQCVRNVETEDGSVKVVYVRAEYAPENTVQPLTADESIPSDFVPVEVETGIYDTTNVEILSGLEEGMEVFTTSQSAAQAGTMW